MQRIILYVKIFMDISSGTESLIIHLESPNGTVVRFQNYGTHSTTYFDDESSKKFGVWIEKIG